MKIYFRVFSALTAALCVNLVSCGFGSEDAAPSAETLSGPSAVLFYLDGEMPEFLSPGEIFTPEVQNQYDFLKTLRKAAYDLNVQEIVLHIGDPTLSLARASEIVAALKQVTAVGKPLVCHIDSVGNVGYFIAAAGCPKILVSPAGGVEALGILAEPLFFREFLASLGISADMLHVGRYKDAVEPLIRDDMSPESREAVQAMITELHRILVDGIATGRKMKPEDVQHLIDSGPFDAQESLNAGLVDEVSPLSTCLAALREKYAGGVNDEYGKPKQNPLSFGELMSIFSGGKKTKVEAKSARVALVPVVGEIASGQGNELMGGSENVYDMSLAHTLAKLKDDESVKAVVLRIDSPGGSALASDNIWHAVRALAAEKPVVASLGDVAASGGYYIASAATEILSIPATITGSIGVLGGKIVFSEAATKLGIHSERIQTGKRAGLGSPFTRFTDDERGAIERTMMSAYNLFVDRVVEGRNLERAKVLEVAEGRVWTGTQAVKFGLVTRMGSLDDAVNRARELAKTAAGTPVEIVPKPKNFMEMIGEAFGEPQAVAALQATKHIPAARAALSAVSLLMRERVLALSPIFVNIH